MAQPHCLRPATAQREGRAMQPSETAKARLPSTWQVQARWEKIEVRQTRLSHPLPQLPRPCRHPQELHQNPPFSAAAGSRQHRGVPGELRRWKGTCGDAQTQLLPFRSRRRRYCYVSTLWKTVFLQQLFKPPGFNFKYFGSWARHSYLLVKRQLIEDVSFEGQGWGLPRREPSQVFLALTSAGN